MKKKILISVALLIITIWSCDVKIKKVPAWIDALLLLTSISNKATASLPSLNGQVIDSASGELITKTINYSFSGTAKEYLKDANGNQLENFSSNTGFITLLVDSAAPINSSNPIKLFISASADGYLSNNVEVVIDKYADISFLIPMVNISTPPAGVSIKQVNVGSANNGVISSQISVTTDEEAQTGGTAGITIPSGTVLRDRNGTPLQGALKATIAYFNNQDENSLLSFPGGLTPNISSDETGKSTEGIFVTGGFTAIEIRDSSGRKAENFSGKATVSIDVPMGTVNPKTNTQVQEGDAFPIWSRDDQTGKWKFEGNGLVTRNGNNFKASIETNHLSYYNLDWFGESCTTGKIKIVGERNKLSTINLVIKGQRGISFIRYKSISAQEDTFSFYNAPKALPLTIRGFVEGVEIGKIDIDDLCDFRKAEFPITVPSFKIVGLEVNLTLNCKSCESDRLSFSLSGPVYNKKPTSPENVYAYYYKSNCNSGWASGCMWQYAGRFSKEGKLNLQGLKAGEKYRLHVYGYYGFPPYFFWRTQEVSLGEIEKNTTSIFVEY